MERFFNNRQNTRMVKVFLVWSYNFWSPSGIATMRTRSPTRNRFQSGIVRHPDKPEPILQHRQEINLLFNLFVGYSGYRHNLDIQREVFLFSLFLYSCSVGQVICHLQSCCGGKRSRTVRGEVQL